MEVEQIERVCRNQIERVCRNQTTHPGGVPIMPVHQTGTRRWQRVDWPLVSEKREAGGSVFFVLTFFSERYSIWWHHTLSYCPKF